ncbi:mannose-1-phosphate guanylyltransferase/mannose-6-phosphate isomerase [Paragemmobacter straminiformis]|uniref:mannose-1-phosphate guanylyltransferase n=1 Tax=Paragemmobacter straminiformis TaxID=2045119 RepID=A0A842IB32_9RHOB|nr:mannose-1-phosphate guanylyltransferase/mannose-6-phosphate isomerase [Gemmobacter straminiformis]MBC2836557.1 mannose-1-phosphate guanylyltransferase/mannose-6-phosphate isomerase [Gemmobacter straminiformis]
MIYPVLLCGGSGTRLWPLSRKSFPKQFTALSGPESLFQATVRRVGDGRFAPPVVVTAADCRFIVAEQMQAAGRDPAAILIEPAPRGTAPAILAAALHLAAKGPETLMLVLPCDHAMPDAAAFRQAVDRGRAAALEGRIVTFGITPTRAETGYGWLDPVKASGDVSGGAAVALRGFVEKPDAAAAALMLAEGGYLWNSGMFLFTVGTLLDACLRHAPDLLAPVEAAMRGARADLGFLRLDPAAWARLPSISIDHAVMERCDGLVVVPFAGEWADLGGWDAVASAMGTDAAGNALGGAVTAIGCEGSLLRSEDAGVELVGIGLRGIIAVASGDAVLVADAARAQEVRLAVDALRAKGARQAEHFARDHRPWGWFQTLALSDRFQVKRIVVKPGAALSLQSHVHRAEHWVVVSGTTRVTIGGDVRLVSENQSVYVPLGAVHRLENPGKVAMHLIEVQTGTYLGEDDITRYDDVYARPVDGAAFQSES